MRKIYLLLILSFVFIGCFKEEKENVKLSEIYIEKRGNIQVIKAEQLFVGLELEGTNIREEDISFSKGVVGFTTKKENKLNIIISKGIKNFEKEEEIIFLKQMSDSQAIHVKQVVFQNDIDIKTKKSLVVGGDTLLGDFNVDGIVDIKDLANIKDLYNVSKKDINSKYDMKFDIGPASLATDVNWKGIYSKATPDEKINLVDFVILAANFGKKPMQNLITKDVTIFYKKTANLVKLFYNDMETGPDTPEWKSKDMPIEANGWRKAVVTMDKTKYLEFCFNNDSNWDSLGGKNYKTSGTSIWIMNEKVYNEQPVEVYYNTKASGAYIWYNPKGTGPGAADWVTNERMELIENNVSLEGKWFHSAIQVTTGQPLEFVFLTNVFDKSGKPDGNNYISNLKQLWVKNGRIFDQEPKEVKIYYKNTLKMYPCYISYKSKTTTWGNIIPEIMNDSTYQGYKTLTIPINDDTDIFFSDGKTTLDKLSSSNYQISKEKTVVTLNETMVTDGEPSEKIVGNTNKTLMQYFEWFTPNTGVLWNQVKNESKNLSDIGITALWLPPAHKGGAGINDVGYGVADWFDLGEFDQYGTVRTKYGTKQQLKDAIDSAHANGINIYMDIVFNHVMGGEEEKDVECLDGVKRSLRTKYQFPAERLAKYSNLNLDHTFFNEGWTVDRKNYYQIKGTTWNNTYGSDSMKIGNNLDLKNPVLKEELKKFGLWYVKEMNLDGFRLDAVKHCDDDFYKEWLDYVREKSGKGWNGLFAVGEVWDSSSANLKTYLDRNAWKMSLFDFALRKKFETYATANGSADMTKIFDGSFVENDMNNGRYTVTFVMNHDVQVGKEGEPVVQDWFKPQAYALILLREKGYPCVFYPDLYGGEIIQDGKILKEEPVKGLEKLILARKLYAYGPQTDYFIKEANTAKGYDAIGWTRMGDLEHPKSMAVLVTDGYGEDTYQMKVKPNMTYYDFTGNRLEKVQTDANGFGNFKVNAKSVSVWVEE